MRLKHPVIYGHPLHAIASDLPAALIPTALVAAIVERARPSRETQHTSTFLAGMALATAGVAGVIGWWDWLSVPGDHPARKPATIHGLINTAGLGVGAAAFLFPRKRLELLLVLNAALVVAAWIGGDLVFRLGWRVRPAEELELIEQGKTREEAREIVDRHERVDLLLSSD